MAKRVKNTQITFINRSSIKFDGTSCKFHPIPGSELANIYVAEYLANHNYAVSVYNNCDCPSENNSVRYIPLKFLENGRRLTTDVAIFVRDYFCKSIISCVKAKKYILWTQDCDRDIIALTRNSKRKINSIANTLKSFDFIVCVSNWHKENLINFFDIKDDKNFVVIYNPVRIRLYKKPVKRNNFRFINTSHPRKSLINLLRVFSKLNRRIRDAELIILGTPDIYAEKWNGLSVFIGGRKKKMSVVDIIRNTYPFGARIYLTPSSIPPNNLGIEYLKSNLYLHPASSIETFGTTVAEAMTYGCIPIVSAMGALPEVVSDAGIVVKSDTARGKAFVNEFVKTVVELMNNRNRLYRLRKCAQDRAKRLFDEKVIGQKWLDLIKSGSR